MFGNLGERRDRAAVALDRENMRRAFGEQRAGQAAGTGADFENSDAVERSSRARDASGQIEIEQKILAERFLRGEVMTADDVAQRR